MKDTTLFVTGGNTGIGFETAKRFAREGVNVAILSLGEERNRGAAAEIRALGVGCIAVTGDVTRAADVEAAVAAAVESFGGLHYAFNNAGISQPMSAIRDQTDAEFDRLFAVNAKGVWMGMRFEIPAMLATGGPAAIVNSASAAGVKAPRHQAIYAGTKHAVVGLTKAAALDHAADGLRVNAIAPGVVDTEMIRRYAAANADHWQTILDEHEMGCTSRPEDVAAAVLFLCRDALRTTGAVLTVDSGLLLH